MSSRWWRTQEVGDPRAALAKVIPRRARVSWWLGLVLALGFAAVVTPAITADRWLLRFGPGSVTAGREAPFTVRAPIHGYGKLRIGGGVVIARGELATADQAALADALAGATPRGRGVYLAFFALTFALAALFTHHLGRSTRGRLVRVQVVSLAVIALLAVIAKIVLLSTALSALAVPIAVLAMAPTMALDRVVGLATGVLAALVLSLLAPFDIGLALPLLVQTAAAGVVIAEHPRRRWLAALTAGAVTTLCTIATYALLAYLSAGRVPPLGDVHHSPWLAAAVGPALAAALAVPVIPLYQLLVGEITQGTLFALEDLGHPLLRRIAEKSPGTWQHSLMMANMAEIAANAIGANGRLVRVGAYFHDLGKSLQPKYFIENLEPGETSPHDLLPPEVSCDAIFAHVTEGIVAARRARLHERIIDFMHMHHGDGVLEYFWAKCREQGNPHQLTVEQFRYPGHPPQSRETALLAICDAVEAASRTLARPDPAAIDSLVQRIVYGKLHLGQLDDSGLSMADLRRISDSLRETIRHANHARIAYPWQKAGQDAGAHTSAGALPYSSTSPRLDSLDRTPQRDSAQRSAVPGTGDAALAATADLHRPDTAPRAAAGDPADARIRVAAARNAQASEPPARPAASMPVATQSTEPALSAPPPARATEPALPAPSAPRPSRPTDQGLPPPPLTSGGFAPPRATPPAPVPVPPRATEPALAVPAPRPTQPVLPAAPPPPPRATGVVGGQSRPEIQTLRGHAEAPDGPPAGGADPDARITTELPVTALRTTAQFGVGPTEAMAALAAGSGVRSGWAEGLAARIDAALDADPWSPEAAITPSMQAALRARRGELALTREQSPEETAQLRRAAEPRRTPHPTSEVDPDDIEAAIEVAPPARRPRGSKPAKQD